jgi:hypothetical protein
MVSAYVSGMETIDGRAMDDAETPSLDDLALRMRAYRERAAAARRLAEAIADKSATIGLLAHAEEFEKKAEAIAAQIVRIAHTRDEGDRGDTTPSSETINTTRPKHR